MNKILTALLAGCFCASAFAGQTTKSGLQTQGGSSLWAPGAVITIKVSHVVAKGAPKGQATEKFKELMEKKFPGRVKVEVGHSSSMFTDSQEAEALDLGIVDVVIPTMGKVANEFHVPEFGVFDLPFLFSSADDVKKYVHSPVADNLLSLVSERNDTQPVAIAYWPNAFRSFSGPIAFHKPEDMKPYGFRVESPSMANFYNSIGVREAVPLPLAVVHKSLEKDGKYKLDGVENPYSNFIGSKLWDVQKVMTISRHSYNGYVFIAGNRFYNSLPEDIKQGFIESAKEAGDFCMQQSLAGEDKLLKEIESKGVQIYRWTPQEKSAFKKASIPVHEKFMKEVNKDFLLETYKELKAYNK
jgi:C4-dicarboxylate-binding protein DctP